VVPYNLLKLCALASRGLRSIVPEGKRVPNFEQNVDRVNTVLGGVEHSAIRFELKPSPSYTCSPL
jgi:hypothetical protein